MIHTLFRQLYSVLTSLQVTVYCLVLVLGLLFAATLAQVNHGIYQVQDIYFQSFFLYMPLPGSSWRIPVLPGGYLLGSILAVNMILSFIRRFQRSFIKTGIYMVHAGLFLLAAGQVVSDFATKESRMVINEGASSNYSESLRVPELVLIRTSDEKTDTVVSFPAKMLRQRRPVGHEQLPFQVEVLEWLPHSRLLAKETLKGKPVYDADQGIGRNVFAIPLPETTKINEVNSPAAYVRLLTDKDVLGTWLVSNHISTVQTLTYGNESYQIQLRPKRYYKPYTVRLEDFSHDRYPGTDIPKNFSSKVRLIDPRKNMDRTVLISMNRPLRYDGDVYYQASFMNNDRTSILQVVRNVALPVPYVSCTLIGLGLLIHFCFHLTHFLKRRMKTA
ncbi:MAG: cytochrome c biogenesis protein ResB [Candidatus Omnitrophota bacterium]